MLLEINKANVYIVSAFDVFFYFTEKGKYIVCGSAILPKSTLRLRKHFTLF